MNDEKFTFYLKKIEDKFPSKQILNQGEMLQCINISRSTFKRIIDVNEIHKIPKINGKEKYKRNTSDYYTYKFHIFDIAKFLAQK
jgi:predicted double-glycine peptidase